MPSMEEAAKRRRLLGQAPGLSLRKLQQLLATLGEDGSGLALSRELNSYLAIETPFGALLQTLVLKCSDSSEFVWTYEPLAAPAPAVMAEPMEYAQAQYWIDTVARCS